MTPGRVALACPAQYPAAMEKLARTELHPDHIVLAESLEYLVEEVLEWCKGAWARARDPIGTSGHGSSHSTRSESSERVS